MSDLLQEAGSMAAAAGCVAAVAVPVGVVCRLVARVPAVPRYRKGFARWDGADALLLFVICLVLPLAVADLLDKSGVFRPIFGVEPAAGEVGRAEHQYRVRTLAGLLLIPVVVVAFQFWKRLPNKEHVPAGREQFRRFVADVAAGVGAWLVLTPVTLAVHFLVNTVCRSLDVPPQEHPLKNVRLQSTGDVLLLFAGACVVAPFFEEMAFRRVLIPWASRAPRRSNVGPGLVGWPYRAWILMACAAACTLARGNGPFLLGAIVFVGLAAAALAVLGRYAGRSRQLPLRPASAVLASATFFAAIHSSVWPTPIPLLVLGVGLGWLVLRTKTVTAAVVAHGLFNAVSAVLLLRG